MGKLSVARLRADRLAKGLCPYCGRHPRGKVGRRCARCRAKHRANAARNRRDRAGLGECSVAGCTHKPGADRTKCPKHLRLQREYDRRYEERLAARLSGKPPEPGGENFRAEIPDSV